MQLKALNALAGEVRFFFDCCVCIQQSVLQYVQEGTAHLAVDCLRRSAGGEVVCLTDLLHAETLAKLGYEGHRGCQASGLCNFLLETVSVFFTDAAHQRAASATREDCVRGSAKAFRISPWRICYRLEVLRSRAASFHILMRFPTYQELALQILLRRRGKNEGNLLFSVSSARYNNGDPA
jgi:hypothetical protein